MGNQVLREKKAHWTALYETCRKFIETLNKKRDILLPKLYEILGLQEMNRDRMDTQFLKIFGSPALRIQESVCSEVSPLSPVNCPYHNIC